MIESTDEHRHLGARAPLARPVPEDSRRRRSARTRSSTSWASTPSAPSSWCSRSRRSSRSRSPTRRSGSSGPCGPSATAIEALRRRVTASRRVVVTGLGQVSALGLDVATFCRRRVRGALRRESSRRPDGARPRGPDRSRDSAASIRRVARDSRPLDDAPGRAVSPSRPRPRPSPWPASRAIERRAGRPRRNGLRWDHRDRGNLSHLLHSAGTAPAADGRSPRRWPTRPRDSWRASCISRERTSPSPWPAPRPPMRSARPSDGCAAATPTWLSPGAPTRRSTPIVLAAWDVDARSGARGRRRRQGLPPLQPRPPGHRDRRGRRRSSSSRRPITPQARGALALAEVVGYGANADAGHLTHPDPNGVARPASLALADAGCRPKAIGYVNAHGTGTAANDAVEARSRSPTIFG